MVCWVAYLTGTCLSVCQVVNSLTLTNDSERLPSTKRRRRPVFIGRTAVEGRIDYKTTTNKYFPTTTASFEILLGKYWGVYKMTFLYKSKYTGGQGKEMLSKSSLVNSEGHTHTAYGVVHANHVILCVLFFFVRIMLKK